MKNIVIIEAPSNLGLIQPAPNRQPGVNQLPQWLKAQGFYAEIIPKHILTLPPPEYSMIIDEASGVRNASAIVGYSIQVGKAVARAVSQGHFPLVIGGDCSILLGCMLGLKQVGSYGLFFMDGHTDFVLPADSSTRAAAGMDLALVTGYGPQQLTNIKSLAPYVASEHVLAFGNRYEEPGYVKTIKAAAIAYYDLQEIRKMGIQPIIARFLAQVNQLAGFWIHLDVDVLDDELMPCVDSRQQGGLSYQELHLTLDLLLNSGLVRGLNITILDPDLDPDGKYTKCFVHELLSVLV